MEELLEQLGLNFKLVFIQLVGFLLLYWLLKKFLFGRVMEMIQKRGDEISGAYENNEKTREEVTALKLQYEQKLKEAPAGVGNDYTECNPAGGANRPGNYGKNAPGSIRA